MPRQRKAKELTVTATTQLTENMRRVTLHGEDLAGFPEDAEGAYFKLVFPGSNPEQPALRTYTVSRFRPQALEIDVDFMLHSNADGTTSGLAAPWSVAAEVGDAMSIFGPGPASFINTDADWYLLVADMTALPALTANLASLPNNAKGYVVIEIIAEADRQPLDLPAGMELIWVVNPQPGSAASPLFEAVAQLRWLDQQVAIWAACEFTTMRKIRQYFRDERQVEKSHLYISSYWKKGLQEEEHKRVKREDSQ